MTIVNSSFILPNGDDLETGTLTYMRTDLLRSASGSAIVTPAETPVNIVDGVGNAASLEPGPYEVRVEADWYLDTHKIVVPPPAAEPAELMDLIEEYQEYEPPVIGEVQQLVAQVQGLATAQDEAVAALAADTDSETRATLDATYAPAAPAVAVTRDANGRVQSVTENGITETYTRDALGWVATITRGSAATQTVSRDTSGRVVGIA